MRRQQLILGLSQVGLLAAAATACLIVSGPDQWRSPQLAALLLAITLVSDLLAVQTSTLRLSGSFLAIVLAMALLGPAPAALIGVISVSVDAVRLRPPWLELLNNLATYTTFPLVGGLVVAVVAGPSKLSIDSAEFMLLVFGVFLATNVLNFVMVAGFTCLMQRESLAEKFRTMFLPVLASEIFTALLAVAVLSVYASVGLGALVLLTLVLLTFQYLVRELLTSQARAEQLRQRGMQLASLHMGVLAAMLRTLSLRDRMTARHSAAVARYASEIASAIGLSTAEQELVHTAGLLHDIGKFVFPDSILSGHSKLSDEEYEIVKRHPSEGASVVRGVDGYGQVADIILCHHERMDGRGYPRGIPGEQIPMASRMISIADTYDVMTARDSYKEPVSSEEAIAELRRVSGTQLDGELVEVFVGLLESRGLVFRHGDDADFEAELGLEKRMREYVEPSFAPEPLPTPQPEPVAVLAA
ncbi:MAG TPA: HD domain-containing phosphohydrolase [Solirubrobacteraceae bacterium]|nr:HD domain-containing phosphohydrolase [Solirubrobacteraceae bacterium]